MTTHDTAATFQLAPHLGHAPGCLCDGCALWKGVLLHPHEDVPRMAFAEWCMGAAESVACRQCEWVEASGYAQRDFSSHASGKCVVCSSPIGRIGSVSNGLAERAALWRVQEALGRMGDRVTFGQDEMVVPWLELNSHGPDFWTFHTAGKTAKVGDRIDVWGRITNSAQTRIGKPKMLHGLVVRRVEDHGSDGVFHAVARDKDSAPWTGGDLRARESKLIADLRTLGAWDAPGLTAVFDHRGLWWHGQGSEQAFGTVRRGSIDEICLPAAAFDERLARAVWSRFPVTACVLSDREPRGSGGVFYFYEATDWRDDPSHLPVHLYRLHLQQQEWTIKNFPTPELALASLSRACVQWGRRLAGLPPLNTNGDES